MKHEHFIVKSKNKTAHIFEITEFDPPLPPMPKFRSSGFWASTASVCGLVLDFGPIAEAGDGRPVRRDREKKRLREWRPVPRNGTLW